MILTAKQITDAVARHDIGIEPFDEKQLQPASYDLRVGEQGITTSSKKKVDLRADGYLVINPGDFAVVLAYETVTLGRQYVGHFGLRSKYARKGLVATTGLQVDPGFNGKLIVGITNLTPKTVTLPYKDDFLSIEFHRLEEDTPQMCPYAEWRHG